ncbi:MAG: ABC transporter ATP-binding protein [Myxococcota bacterium]|nr:ABC transporter ATP-binding protein [Myxococcota bacterium]
MTPVEQALEGRAGEPPGSANKQEGTGAPDLGGRDAIVVAENLGKRFDIYLNDRSRFFEFFGRRRHHEAHWALRDVSFSIPRGSAFGIIGSNGAGKSTLLRLVGGISEPTTGRLEVRGRYSTLLDLGLGFHDMFSGRENIHLNCSLLGMSREQIEARIPDIIGFAELAEFIDYPVRTYSAGMLLRLGFAIAAHMDTELFLIDEVLTVGDQYFQRKCVRKIESVLEEGKTIVLVSHDLHAIRSLCDTVMWVDGGTVRAIGPAREVVERYTDADRSRPGWKRNSRSEPEQPKGAPSGMAPTPMYRSTVDDPAIRRAVVEACRIPDVQEVWATPVETQAYEKYDGERAVLIGSGEVQVMDVQMLDGNGQPRRRFQTGESLLVAVTFRTTQPVERPILGISIHRNDDVYVFGPNTRFDGVLDGTYDGIYTFFIHYPDLQLLTGSYQVSVAAFDKNHLKPHVWHNQLYDFEVAQEIEDHGLVRMKHEWGLLAHVEGESASVSEIGLRVVERDAASEE